jgi:hypothetical protein
MVAWELEYDVRGCFYAYGVPVFRKRPVDVLRRGSRCRLPEASPPCQAGAYRIYTPVWGDDNVNTHDALNPRRFCKSGIYRRNFLDQLSSRDVRRDLNPLLRGPTLLLLLSRHA